MPIRWGICGNIQPKLSMNCKMQMDKGSFLNKFGSSSGRMRVLRSIMVDELGCKYEN